MKAAVPLRPAHSNYRSIGKDGLIAIILVECMLTAFGTTKADERVTESTLRTVDNFDLDVTDLQFWKKVGNLLNRCGGWKVAEEESSTFVDCMVLIGFYRAR